MSSESGDEDHYDDNSDWRFHQKWRVGVLEDCVNNTIAFVDIRIILDGNAAENIQAIILKNISLLQKLRKSHFETLVKN